MGHNAKNSRCPYMNVHVYITCSWSSVWSTWSRDKALPLVSSSILIHQYFKWCLLYLVLPCCEREWGEGEERAKCQGSTLTIYNDSLHNFITQWLHASSLLPSSGQCFHAVHITSLALHISLLSTFQFECCGIEDPTDWRRFLVVTPGLYPHSCCKESITWEELCPENQYFNKVGTQQVAHVGNVFVRRYVEYIQ